MAFFTADDTIGQLNAWRPVVERSFNEASAALRNVEQAVTTLTGRLDQTQGKIEEKIMEGETALMLASRAPLQLVSKVSLLRRFLAQLLQQPRPETLWQDGVGAMRALARLRVENSFHLADELLRARLLLLGRLQPAVVNRHPEIVGVPDAPLPRSGIISTAVESSV